MKSAKVLELIAKNLVDNPDDVEVVVVDGDRNATLELHVHDDDLGKVIGKRGRTAKAIRAVVKAVASLDDESVNVDIVD
ncbi:MAG TPA: KH domain-containing protein [Nitriliruptorales bacterium]